MIYYLFILIFIIESSFAQNTPRNVNRGFYKSFFSANETKQDSLSDKYDVTEYAIQIEIHPDVKELSGRVGITFVVLDNNLDNLSLDLSDLEVDSIFHGMQKTNFFHENDKLNIQLKNSLQNGSVDSVFIYYHGKPNKGLYFRENIYGDVIVYSHNEPYDAHYWFPCKDVPSDKAILNMSVTMPVDYKILGNGKLVNTLSIDTNIVQYHWYESYPICTYLISLAASRYDVVTQIFNWGQFELPVEYYLYPQDRQRGEIVLNNTVEMLEYFSAYIETYPFIHDKYAMSEVPFQEAAAMENQTATTMGDFVMDNESVIAHELAHQWWGDALSPETFKDIWLNEGFATYFDELFTEHKYGKDAFTERMVRSASNVLSDGSNKFAIYDPPQQYLFGSAVYHKGAWVLHMLRNEVGDNTFKDIMKTYYNNFKYGNVTTADFISICESVSGKSLQSFFDQWVFSAGMPRIFASWEKTNGQMIINLEQLQQDIIYNLELELQINGIRSDTLITLNFDSKEMVYKLPFPDEVVSLEIDPNHRILNSNNSPVYVIPRKSELVQVFPNPFNNELNIFYSVDRPQNISIEIWNVLGEKVKTIYTDQKRIGTHKFVWQSSNIASGAYYCILKSEDGMDSKKIVLVK